MSGRAHARTHARKASRCTRAPPDSAMHGPPSLSPGAHAPAPTYRLQYSTVISHAWRPIPRAQIMDPRVGSTSAAPHRSWSGGGGGGQGARCAARRSVSTRHGRLFTPRPRLRPSCLMPERARKTQDVAVRRPPKADHAGRREQRELVPQELGTHLVRGLKGARSVGSDASAGGGSARPSPWLGVAAPYLLHQVRLVNPRAFHLDVGLPGRHPCAAALVAAARAR